MTVPDMQDIIGQAHAKRALEVAAAGGHHTFLVGPTGAGKTLLTNALRVEEARQRQRERGLHYNADMGPAEVRQHCQLDEAGGWVR